MDRTVAVTKYGKGPGVYHDGKIHVQSEKCATCIFRPGNPMFLEPGRVKDMVTRCQEMEGGNIPCHQTLFGAQAICRGFWDGYADDDWMFRLAKEMDLIEEVES